MKVRIFSTIIAMLVIAALCWFTSFGKGSAQQSARDGGA